MMFQKIGFLSLGLVLFVSCGSNTTPEKKVLAIQKDTVIVSLDKCDKLLKEAQQNDVILLNAIDVKKEVAERAIISFYNFANLCGKDSLAPVFLVKAGQVAQSIGKLTQAEAFFIKCKDDFPDFKNRGAALFLLAQLYDDPSKLNNESEARTIYHQILREYPNTSFAADSKACIANIGKTDEELVKEFLKKNK